MFVSIGKSCGSPPSITHMVSSAPYTLYGDAATYTCDAGAGYEVQSGDGGVNCQADATWTTPTLQCQGTDKYHFI